MPPQDPVTGTVKTPANEHLKNGLSPVNQQHYLRLKQSMFEVAKERPELDTRVFTEYMQDYLNSATARENAVKAKFAAAKAAGVTPDRNELNRENKREQSKFIRGFVDTKLPAFGADGKEAWKALHNKMEGPSIFSAAFGQVYDKSKGGVQWGGIVGLLAGAFMATQLTGGLMTGELMPILMTVGAGFLGAWLGNKATDGVSNLMASPPETPAPQTEQTLQREAAPPTQQQQQGPLTPEIKEQAKQAVGDDTPSQTPPPAPPPAGSPSRGTGR